MRIDPHAASDDDNRQAGDEFDEWILESDSDDDEQII
jgi:hypothetical protein